MVSAVLGRVGWQAVVPSLRVNDSEGAKEVGVVDNGILRVIVPLQVLNKFVDLPNGREWQWTTMGQRV